MKTLRRIAGMPLMWAAVVIIVIAEFVMGDDPFFGE